MKELMFKPGMSDYGYGIVINTVGLSDKSSVKAIQHSGGINGFNSNFVRLIDGKHLIVILDNVSMGERHGALISAISNILNNRPYEMPKRSIGETISDAIAADGINSAIKEYRDIKAANSKEYDFAESELNTLGYQLLQRGKIAEAGEIFKLNVEMFPASANPHDSLGEYYAMGGQRDLAIASYRKALSIDPKFPSALAAIARLEGKSVAVDPAVLGSYVGRYELAPNFVIEVTLSEGKLHGQATGQPKFTMEPISETRFAIRVVNAEIAFQKVDAGGVIGLILFQGGREMKGMRLSK
jgi:tetratricopeptide (TPR) repeat protein